MGALPKALEISFEVQRKKSNEKNEIIFEMQGKKSNEKITRRKISFSTCKMCFFLFSSLDPFYFQIS